jgi:hypothetical protein
VGSNGRAALSEIPSAIADTESLYRRIHPDHVKPDGSLSSQAFRDPEMSVDRAEYCTPDQTLHGYPTHGVSAFLASFARQQAQQVVSAPELFNPAHALVNGAKSKSVARAFARTATWIIKI